MDQWKKLNAFFASVGLFRFSKICSASEGVKFMEVKFLVIVSQFCLVLNELDIEVIMVLLFEELLKVVVCECEWSLW